MTTQAKTKQANYSAEAIAIISTEYQNAIAKAIANKTPLVEANKAILADLSAKHGKTTASLRAKLASLKVYVSESKDSDTANKVSSKITKEQITSSISKSLGVSCDGLEAAPKTVLLAIALKLVEQDKKISDLIADLTSDSADLVDAQ